MSGLSRETHVIIDAKLPIVEEPMRLMITNKRYYNVDKCFCYHFDTNIIFDDDAEIHNIYKKRYMNSKIFSYFKFMIDFDNFITCGNKQGGLKDIYIFNISQRAPDFIPSDQANKLDQLNEYLKKGDYDKMFVRTIFNNHYDIIPNLLYYYNCEIRQCNKSMPNNISNFAYIDIISNKTPQIETDLLGVDITIHDDFDEFLRFSFEITNNPSHFISISTFIQAYQNYFRRYVSVKDCLPFIEKHPCISYNHDIVIDNFNGCIIGLKQRK